MPQPGVFTTNALQKAQQILLRSRETIRRSQEVLRISRAVQSDRERSQRAKALKRSTMQFAEVNE